MRYMLLVYGEEMDFENTPPDEIAASLEAFTKFHDEMAERGGFLTADRLQPANTAKVVRVRDGEVLATDGPFAETREVMGGVYIFDCKDMNEAMEIAAKCPSSWDGAVEVRPIMEAPVEEDYSDAKM